MCGKEEKMRALHIHIDYATTLATQIHSAAWRFPQRQSKMTKKNDIELREWAVLQQMVWFPLSPDLIMKSVWDYIKQEPKFTEEL